MRKYEPTDRALIGLRSERDDLSVQTSLLKDGAQPDPTALFAMQQQLELLDRRIANHTRVRDA